MIAIPAGILALWCASDPLPWDHPAELGREYPHHLYVHCGITFTRFDGRHWLADLPLHLGGPLRFTPADPADTILGTGTHWVDAPSVPDGWERGGGAEHARG